jgi:plastocyanin
MRVARKTEEGTPLMNRRITVAVAATAAVGLATAGIATTAGAAAKKNEIRIVGGEKFKAGEFLKIDLRFKPRDVTVKKGAVVKVVNKTKGEPHTISFVEKRYLPTSFDVAVNDRLLAAHQVDPTDEEAPPGVLVVDNGAAVPAGELLEADTGFTPDVDGDSAFIAPEQDFSFKVTADKGSRLFYFCAIHPWMQGKIKVN